MKFFPLVYLVVVAVQAQVEVNQFDNEGKRHGVWRKFYEGTDQLRYEGHFDHGKEIGEFKFYKPKSGKNPTAVMFYKKNTDTVDVNYFSSKETLISKGQLKDKKRVGDWVYFHNNSSAILMKEQYQNDLLHGEKSTFFKNGAPTEIIQYQNGKKEGEYKLFSEKGILLQRLQYRNNELDGKAIYYNGKGEKTIEGFYNVGRKDGHWTYFINGEVDKEIRFPLASKKQND